MESTTQQSATDAPSSSSGDKRAKARNYVTSAQAEVKGVAGIVPVSRLRPNTFNYNVQKPETFNKTVESIRSLGFVSEVLVRSGNDNGPFTDGRLEIINGEHRWRAAQMLGMSDVPVRDLGNLPDVQAKRLCVILNELSGDPDQVRLAELLRDVSKDIDFDELLSSMPFQERELQMYLDAVDFSFATLSDADTRRPAPEEEGEEEPVAVKKPSVPTPTLATEKASVTEAKFTITGSSDTIHAIESTLRRVNPADLGAALVLIVEHYRKRVLDKKARKPKDATEEEVMP